MIRLRSDRGVTIPIIALVIPVLITMTAFATDLGRQRASRRTMQARADIVALDMVRLANGRTEDQITGADPSAGTTPALYAAYVQDTADRNDVAVSKLTIEWGIWNGITFTPTVGNAVPTAVQVVATETTDYYFRPGTGTVSRTAVATTDPRATLTVGTTLAEAQLGNAPLLNGTITSLLCSTPDPPPPPDTPDPPPPPSVPDTTVPDTTVPPTTTPTTAPPPTTPGVPTTTTLPPTTLPPTTVPPTTVPPTTTTTPPPLDPDGCPHEATITAGGYQGLATHDVTLEDLREAGGFGSVDEMMNHEFTLEEWARLSGQAFRNNGDPSTAEAYDGENNSLAEASDPKDDPDHPERRFTPADVASVESQPEGSGASASVNPFDWFMAGLLLSNGDNFAEMPVSVDPISLPAGISNLTLTSVFKVIEAPRSGSGRVGDPSTTNLRTAQLQLLYTLSFDVDLTVQDPDTGQTSGVTGTVALPIDVSGGGATATLTEISCAQPSTDPTIDVLTAPRALVGTVGKSFSPTNPETVGTLQLRVGGVPVGSFGVSVFGYIGGSTQNTFGTELEDILEGTTESANGSAFTFGGAIGAVRLQTGDPDPIAPPGVDPIDPPGTAIEQGLEESLNDLLAQLDADSQPYMQALGLSTGTADVHNVDVLCLAPRLAA